MTNKQAFQKLLFNYYLVDENGKGEHDELVEQVENALDILEIIASQSYEINFITTHKNQEQVDKVHRWLKNYQKGNN